MTDPFFRALQWLWPIEGGWWAGDKPSDPNPTMYGITETTWKAALKKYGWSPRPVRTITKTEATTIYWLEYWLPSGANTMTWPMALVHFDACVNHGLGNARKLLRRANGTWEGYIAARRQFYAAIIANNPAMRPNERGWENRMRKLEAACREALPPSNTEG